MSTLRTELTQLLTGKRVLVFGLGLQGGVRVANRLVELGAQVRVTDKKTAHDLQAALEEIHPSIQQSLGTENATDVEWADLIVKNPGVPFDHPLIRQAEQAGKRVTSEVALVMQFLAPRVIGVTGTRGKTTTTSLIAHILQQSGRAVELGGNIPQRPALDVALAGSDQSWYVFELSSFQLESLERERISPHAAVLTSLSPDHLNRYSTLENYYRTKASIFRWQRAGDQAFLHQAEAKIPEISEALKPGVQQYILDQAETQYLAAEYQSALPGAHNQANVALAVTVCQALGVEKAAAQRAVTSFSGVPYRQQIIPTLDDLIWINDTTATTPTALQTALAAQGTQPFILILGGTTKNLPFPAELLRQLQALKAQTIWLAGSGTTELQKELQIDHKSYATMTEAVAAARQLAQQTGISRILFSPGFSSFEHFTNEFDRGDQFNAALQSAAIQT